MPQGNPLAYLLSPPTAPSAFRSSLAQALLEQSMQQRPYSGSFGESLNIAARPIMSALLAKREEKARTGQMNERRQLAEQLLGGVRRNADISIGDPLGGPPSVTRVRPQLNQEEQMRSSMAGWMAQDPSLISDVVKSRITAPKRGEPQTSIGKINADIEAGNISKEVGVALAQAEFKRDARSIGEAEATLRKEFNQNLSGVTSALRSLDNARNLLGSGNPIAAQAALTSFIRAIDDSVVRPSEMEQYQGISGIARGLENRISLLMGQGPFSEESRKDILESINALAKSAESIRRGAIDYYSGLADSSGLKPQNVTGFTFGPTATFNQGLKITNAAPNPITLGPAKRNIE